MDEQTTIGGGMNMYGDSEDNILAPKEPLVTSANPAERKQARALRIKRRQEALKKLDLPSESEFEDIYKPCPVELATMNAAEVLQRLSMDGQEKVCNVRVTADEREVDRRYERKLVMNEFLEKMMLEAEAAEEEYQNLTEKWPQMMEVSDPLELDEVVKGQRQLCDELLAQKNDLIGELKKELIKIDDAYVDDLDKQDKDIKELSVRIEKQITIMQRAYEKQMFLIEEAIQLERSTAIEHNQKRWEAIFKQRDREELAHIDDRFEQVEDFDTEMDEIMWDHYYKFRETRRELELLVQELQRELEKLKGICIINSEKIGYNYLVLKKREEENLLVRSEQKRRLNRLTDNMTAIKNKLERAREQQTLEQTRSSKEIAKMREAMEQLQIKAHLFASINDYKWRQTWLMNVSRCKELWSDVCEAESIIYTSLLAMDPPQQEKLPAPMKLALVSKQEPEQKEEELTTKHEFARKRLVKHILCLVADNTGFLVEERLHELLKGFPKTSKNLCTIDAIFNALEIGRVEDIDLLCDVMLKYAYCPKCKISGNELISHCECADEESNTNMNVDLSADGKETAPDVVTDRSVPETSCSPEYTSKIPRSDELSYIDNRMLNEVKDYIENDQCYCLPWNEKPPHEAEAITKPAKRYLCKAGHDLEVSTTNVYAALADFVSQFISPEKEKLNDILDSLKPLDNTRISNEMSHKDVCRYWNQFINLYPPEKEKFWDQLIDGLNEYYNVLKERSALHAEVVALRNQQTMLCKILDSNSIN